MANYTFSNTSLITINDLTAASPYPAAISVSGTTGLITGIQVTINGLNHTYPGDIDILLVGPNGEKVLLMSDAGYGYDVNGINLTFTDSAISSLPDSTQILSGTYKPTDYQPDTDSFPASAPSGPYGTSLSAFNNITANGTWKLFVVDDASGDIGSISSGWSLDITTAQPQPVQFNVSSLFNADGKLSTVITVSQTPPRML
ncbi:MULTISPECIES: proprotein convertase P-domain-containing protein [Calothrix]|uniref:Proprotein convertase P-domain-containing protein n=2 Tax=Calothrix TaxID=1186 RepID=A0ABR8A3P3_9CYAN|nr:MULTISPECIES: proprotein convertase P-domain-containing protein [Calothrix]MBD2194383.1 proprotein convertase P-domain-containing protein [Calothrix parietina FACHB-288]MBD2223165.1 proprotein convertase P-domain-containing protein [Calothrix anomala FACHB-343]